MGMDGLSFSNTGAVKETTSAEYTSRTEQSIHSEAIQDSQQVQNLSVNQRIRRKEEDESTPHNQQQEQKKDDEEENEFQDGLIEDLPEEEIENEIEDIENPNKDFYVKLNVKDDIIELYDSATNRLIETISGNELGELVQKLNMASGIFVNKKV